MFQIRVMVINKTNYFNVKNSGATFSESTVIPTSSCHSDQRLTLTSVQS